MKRYVSILILTLLFFSLPPTVVTESYTDVTVSEAKTMIDSNPSLVILDVRGQSEYDSGHVRNAKLIPHTELEGRLDELNKTDEILVYCRSGVRSSSASQILANNGFLYVYNMLGGITAWIAGEYPVYVKYSSIQQAINNADEEDAIFVSSGIYYENVVVNKKVSLIGENRNKTIISGYYTYGTSVVSITADYVRIDRFTIQNGWCGIAVYSSNGCIITENRILNDTYHGGEPEMYESGRGVWLVDSENCTVASNLVNSNDRNISLEGANNNMIMNNIIMNSLMSWGIVLENSHNNNINNNVVAFSVYDGIYLAGADNNYIFANFVMSNGDEGVYIGGSNNTVTRNIVQNNSGEGIWLDWSDNNTVIENTLMNNEKRGIFVWHSTYTMIYHNSFINNSWGQAYSNLINSWDNDCEGNYWSDYNETDFDEYGIGYTQYVIDANNTDRYPLMSPYLKGDINHDARVNSVDLFILAPAYGSTPENPNWNPHADLNCDGDVDSEDLFTLAANYGKKWE